MWFLSYCFGFINSCGNYLRNKFLYILDLSFYMSFYNSLRNLWSVEINYGVAFEIPFLSFYNISENVHEQNTLVYNEHI